MNSSPAVGLSSSSNPANRLSAYYYNSTRIKLGEQAPNTLVMKMGIRNNILFPRRSNGNDVHNIEIASVLSLDGMYSHTAT